jgi:hypothetical protein
MNEVELINKKDSLIKINKTISKIEKKHDDYEILECTKLGRSIEKDLLNDFAVDIYWNNVHTLYKITKWEALLLTMNLPVINYHRSVTIKNYSRACEETLNNLLFKDTFEYKQLDRSGLFPKTFDISAKEEWAQEAFTKSFINWTLDDAKLTRLIDDDNANSRTNKAKSNIESYNENYRKWSEFHNARVVITAYENIDLNNKNPNSFIDSDKYYNQYKGQLIPKSEAGDLPARTTLRDYIYKYNKFIKSIAP